MALVTIQAVLDNIQIEIGHIHHAEVVDCMQYGMELISVIARNHTGNQLIKLHQRPLVKLLELLIRQQLRGIKAVQVAENIARRIADFQIVLGQVLEHFLGNTHILPVIGRGHPQTQNIRAIILQNLLRADAVAQRLGHLLPLFIHNHAVCDNRLIRRNALDRNRGQHRRLEPAAVLVVAFQVNVRREL